MVGRRERRALAALSSLLGVGTASILTTLLSGGDAVRALQLSVFLIGFGLGPGVILALCADALLTRLGLLSWCAYATAGFVGGGFLSALFGGVAGRDPNGFITGLACGLAGGLAYWAALRPDRREY
jgi:hypothetical protein